MRALFCAMLGDVEHGGRRDDRDAHLVRVRVTVTVRFRFRVRVRVRGRGRVTFRS